MKSYQLVLPVSAEQKACGYPLEMRPSPLATVLFLSATLSAQEWPYYAGDAGGSKYSPMKDIHRENVQRLRPAWIFHTKDVSDGTRWPTRSAFESTPLVVDGIMYVTTPFSRVIALDAETGGELWSFDPRLDLTESTNLFINRGAAYWREGSKRRVFLGTIDGRLFSLYAENGRLDDSFGTGGWVDLRKGIADNLPGGQTGNRTGMTSGPVVYKNLVICGSLVPDGEPHGPAGDVRAFDTQTGKLVWTFHTIPRAGEFGNNTWAEGSWQNRGGANAWPPMSVDLQRGILFIPLTSPATDLYGGDRKGQGLFGDSLVAVDASTGKRLWHFQTVHHNLWDYDLPAQPVLVQVRKEGKLIDAVAQVTKTGFTFVFDRVSGEPIFPIEEVPVPASEVPGESAWPTQPRPLKPPPYARQSMTADELGNVTPETRAYCSKLIDGAVFGTLFTPVGLKKTVLFPGTNGGANWGGASFDPETHTLYVNSMDVGMVFRMTKRAEGSEIPYRPQGLGSPSSRFWDPNLIPCQQPPWGFLTAINLDEGNFRWRSVLGVVDSLVERGLPPTGAPNIGGSLVTAGGLVFIGATNDSRFRAFDKDTGKELWVTRLPASAHATPMTFRGKTSGRQFVVIAAGGGNKYNNTYSDSLIAFALPSNDSGEPLVSSARETSHTRDSVTLKPELERRDEVFSHPTHEAAEFACTRCHATALTGTRAGFPTGKACLPCHRGIAQNKEIRPPSPVYRLPDFVIFRHGQHAAKGIRCETCHGNVWSQDPIVPVLAMKMKACVDCHQANHAPVTCTTCHELTR